VKRRNLRGEVNQEPDRHRPPRKRKWLIALGTLILVLAVLQLVAAPITKSVLNRRLGELSGYSGRAEAVTIALWRGGLELRDFVLTERGHEKDPPLLQLKKAAVRFSPLE